MSQSLYKITKKAVFAFASACALILFPIVRVCAEDIYVDFDAEKVISDKYEDFYSSLGTEIKDKLPEDFGVSPENDATAITSWDFILGALGESFASGVRTLIPSFARLLAMILIISLLHLLTDISDAKSANIISGISSLCISAAFIFMQYDTVLLVKERLSDISALASCMLPVFVTLYGAGGNVSGAYVSGGGLGIFIFALETVLSKLALPFFGSVFCLAAVSSSGYIKLGGLIRSVKRAYTNFLTFTMSVFCAILAGQSLIASGKDSVSLRAVRFITSSTLPVVGSSVGETLKTFASGIGMLRKSVGVIGVVIILLLTLPTVILLLLNGSAISFTASFAEMLGCQKEKELLETVHGIYGCLTATLAVASLMFAFMLILLASAGVAIKG